jgi:hypothetical protein
MPADDLVLNVRQIAGYTPTETAPPTSSLLLQLGGLGGPYASISPTDLVGSALAQGGDMAIAGLLQVQAVSGGSANFANATANAFWAQKASIANLNAAVATINCVPIATVDYVSNFTVASFMGRTGAVTLWIDDVIAAGGAPIYSPRFVGCPRADTPGPCSNSTRLATTEFVQRAIVLYLDSFLQGYPLVLTFNGRSGPVTLTADDIVAANPPYAPIDSPNFSGVPTAPTAGVGNATGQLATTAFVMNAVSDSTTGVVSFNTRTGAVVLQASDLTGVGGALLASPALTGVPTAPTATGGTATAQLATTAFVAAAVAGVVTGVSSFNTRTGAVTLTATDLTDAGGALVVSTVASFNTRTGPVSLLANDLSAVGGALLASPAFTGAPTAPTAAPGTNTAQLATTAFVEAAVGGVSSGVVTFNGRAGAVTLTLADVTGAGGAPLAAPAFTGAPSAPTAPPATSTTQLATCAFVAAAIAALPATPIASTVAPLINGTANAGVSAAWSRGDHVHPTDTTRYAASNPSGFQTAAQVTASLANYLPLSGGTISGNLTSSGGSMFLSTASATYNLYNSSNIYSDANVFAIGESGSAALGTSWRYVYTRTTGGRVWWNSGGTGLMQLDPSGNLIIVGSLTQASDLSLKRDVEDAPDGIEEVRLMRPRRYRRTIHDHPPADVRWTVADREELGFVAQEMQDALPHAVVEDGAGQLGVSLMPLIAALTNAVKQLDARLAALGG